MRSAGRKVVLEEMSARAMHGLCDGPRGKLGEGVASMSSALSELVCSSSRCSTRNLSERHQPSPVALAEVLARAPTRVLSSRVSRCGKPAAASVKAGPREGNLSDRATIGGQAHREMPCHARGRVAASEPASRERRAVLCAISRAAARFAGPNLSTYRRSESSVCLEWTYASAKARVVQQSCNGDKETGRGQGLMSTGTSCRGIAPLRGTDCTVAAAATLIAAAHCRLTTTKEYR